MSFELNIVDMYSDILNIYGDIGNLKCIKKRCEWRGIKVNQKSYSLNHDMSFDYEDIDLILIGGGSDRTQSIVSNDLLKQRNDLENYVENDGVILTVCGSYQMFGHEYYDVNGDNVSCLEIFDIKTVSQENRLIGNILIENNLGTCSPNTTCREVMIKKDSAKEIVCSTAEGKKGISHGKR